MLTNVLVFNNLYAIFDMANVAHCEMAIDVTHYDMTVDVANDHFALYG